MITSSRTHGKWSDIDITVKQPDPIPFVIVGELMSIFEASHIPYKIQIVDFSSVSPAMQKNILDERVIWKN
jgi:hypothetical protein